MKLAHVVNPVRVLPASDLYVAQPITFETMRRARDFAAGAVDVTLLAAGFAEDAVVFPADFVHLPPLRRSVLDVAHFRLPRRLPLLQDILDAACAATDAEVLVYTNVDIGLQPHFYTAVQRLVEEAGHDVFVVNRRTISARYTSIAEIPLMWRASGQPHRGWDCFVFPRALQPRFRLGAVCVGATRVGLALLANLVAYGRAFRQFTDAHLTFHLGDARSWLNPAFADYDAHNTRELTGILAALERERGPFPRESIPGAFLWRKRKFGPLYEFWSRHVYLPGGVSLWANRLLRAVGR